ncbi:MAG: tRNA (adenosine(37)-N6)-threonylcarbamoyltransferase complex ATPase subunit type 1 TsaE [Clostridia bacterium]|nr:tRNA (adenosine(37)-N6)-threonylcarbamoyltransferase complex ATPase subunit type 1 TsaE [Clostridia bacterium]
MKITTRMLTGMAMLSALSIVSLALGIQFPFPFTPNYMLYDVADVFIFLGTFMYGPVSGLIITFVVCVIQAFAMGGSGLTGFIMHLLATGVYALVAGLIYQRKRNIKGAILALICGFFSWMVVIIPANLLAHPLFGGIAIEVVVGMIPAILLFNLVKAGANSILTFLLYKQIHKFFRFIGVAEKKEKNYDIKSENVFITNSANETLSLAKAFAKELNFGDTVLLNGDLGAGKTVFARGIAQSFGVKEDVLSPTFNILKEYLDGKLCHFDMYRIEDDEELENLGFEEYFSRDRICIVEWNRMPSILGRVYTVNIETNGKKRKITITKEDR